jgi:hypothetical protein
MSKNISKTLLNGWQIMNHILTIGSSDGGISATMCVKEVDPHTEVTVVVSDHFPNYSICGLPLYLSGKAQDWRTLAHRTTDDIAR